MWLKKSFNAFREAGFGGLQQRNAQSKHTEGMLLFWIELLGFVLQKAEEFSGRFDSGRTSLIGWKRTDLGLLDDASPTEELRIWVEPQTHLQDLYFDEIKPKKPAHKTASSTSKRTTSTTDLSECNVEYGFYAWYFGKWQKSAKFKYHWWF